MIFLLGSDQIPQSTQQIASQPIHFGLAVPLVSRSTGWQPHTVRGFFAAVVRKKLGAQARV
jgi:Protein of unknown function (DUF3489)